MLQIVTFDISESVVKRLSFFLFLNIHSLLNFTLNFIFYNCSFNFSNVTRYY